MTLWEVSMIRCLDEQSSGGGSRSACRGGLEDFEQCLSPHSNQRHRRELLLKTINLTSLVLVFPKLVRVHSLVIFVQRSPGIWICWRAIQYSEHETDDLTYTQWLTVANRRTHLETGTGRGCSFPIALGLGNLRPSFPPSVCHRPECLRQ